MSSPNFSQKQEETPRNWRRFVVPLIVAFLLCGATVTAVTMAHLEYRDRILPHVSVAGISLGGMDKITATQTLQAAYDEMLNGGLIVAYGEDEESIDLFSTGSSESDIAYALIDFDPSAAADQALSVGRNDSTLLSAFGAAYYVTIGEKNLNANIALNGGKIMEAVRSAFPDVEIEAEPTDFAVTFRRGTPTIAINEGVSGIAFDESKATEALQNDAMDLSLRTLSLSTITTDPEVSTNQAETLVSDAELIISAAPYTLSGTTNTGQEKTWEIDNEMVSDWIVPGFDRDGALAIRLEPEAMVEFLETLHDEIDLAPENARFQIEDGRVVEFKESSIGVSVDEDELFSDLSNVLGTSGTTIAIATRTEEPTITTNDANGLGIKEALGLGWSSFKGSSWGRRSNIEAGVDMLNGLLIAPGETISAVEELGPFTTDNGYIPELVIKGDEIKAEMGGGACQIGSTLFRAAMNSGLEIVERRNHSLATSYYNDPTNGNPGTDATLYDPSPDLKIKNTTDNYVLLVIEITDESELLFTFWGTSDGREAYYTAPTVLTRTSPGATQYKETDSLPSGETKCQNGFTGYTTTFDYVVTYADGTTETQEFFSSYRALPQICLVGTGGGTDSPDISQ